MWPAATRLIGYAEMVCASNGVGCGKLGRGKGLMQEDHKQLDDWHSMPPVSPCAPSCHTVWICCWCACRGHVRGHVLQARMQGCE